MRESRKNGPPLTLRGVTEEQNCTEVHRDPIGFKFCIPGLALHGLFLQSERMWHSLPGTEAHLLLEVLAYFLGARVYWHYAPKLNQPALADRLLLLGSAIFAAMLGSKVLHVLEHLPYLLAQRDWALWLGGKSVLGGFLGGTLGVELAKKAVRWQSSTGDPWVPALTVGLFIGRLGCQLSGTWDQTYGIPTRLPWAWDYGDGVGRHPTGLYEMALLLVAYGATRLPRVRARSGAAFALFLALYCLIRLGLEWLKPPFGLAAPHSLPVALYGPFTAIQWAACVGAVCYLCLLRYRIAVSKP